MDRHLIADPDAVDVLLRRSPLERHSIARILEVDGPALAVLNWIVEQPDCDIATLAMIFWRMRSLAPRRQIDADFPAIRNLVLTNISNRLQGRASRAADIAWDGREAWELTPLIGAQRIDGICDLSETARLLAGPFGLRQAEPACLAFLDEDHAADDIFDAMWRTQYTRAGVADWLDGKPAPVWVAAIDDLMGSHPDEIFAWMVRHPDCPDAVAARLKAGLPESLAYPEPGHMSQPVNLDEDFIWWVVRVSLSGLVPRPRAEALREWRASLEKRERPKKLATHEAPVRRSQSDENRNFRRLNTITAVGGAITILLWRTGLTKPAAFALIGLLLFVPIYMGFASIGSFRRQVGWIATVGAIGIAMAFLFRYIDKGVVF